MFKYFYKRWLLMMIIIMTLLLSSCSKEEFRVNNQKNPVVTIQMETGEKIVMDLYPKFAPNTVNNFINLIQSKYYNNVIFHRVIPDFVIQGGDKKGTGLGNPGFAIKGEFSENNFKNNLKHKRGILSMARDPSENDSASTQFFIVVKDQPTLDGKYATFGEVTQGMEVVDKISKSKRNKNDKPIKNIKMSKVTVETFGVKYATPKRIKK